MNDHLVKASEDRRIKKLVAVGKTDLNADQILRILQKTPEKHIYTRPAKGGGTWEYVTGTYVKKVLNYTFAWNWDFEIKNHGVEGDMVWVLGRLTARSGNTTIVKEQFGRADCKKKKDGTGFLDYGNDLKAAATDALKKCAAELGVASDVYGKEEFKEIKREDLLSLPTPDSIQKKRESRTKVEAGVIVSDLPSQNEDHESPAVEETAGGQGGEQPAPLPTHLGVEELLAKKREELKNHAN